jgi:hypothetical protein
MTEPMPSATDASEPSDVRFSMRALLLMMVGVAVAAAALGPHFRGLKPEDRGPVAALWVGTGLVVLALVTRHARTRYQLEKDAGSKILALEPRGRWISHHRLWVTVLNGCVIIAFGLFQMLRIPSPDQTIFPMLIRGGIGALCITLGIVFIWWNQKVQLRANGALYGLRFLQWNHITAHRWQELALMLEGVDQLHRDAQFHMNVSLADRPMVAELLRSKLIARDGPPGLNPWDDVAEAFKLPKIEISAGQNVTWRGVAIGLSVYVLTLITIIFRPWGSPTQEFVGGFFFVVVLLVAWSIYRHGSVGRAGTPLIRLRAQTDWRKTFVAVLTSIGANYVAQKMQVVHAVIDGALGAISGFGIATIFAMVLLQRFDLCENGIVVMKWKFWPWDTMEVAKWNCDGNGRLVLGKGWRRVIAKVPQDLRTAVDALLKEKVGASMSTTSSADQS